MITAVRGIHWTVLDNGNFVLRLALFMGGRILMMNRVLWYSDVLFLRWNRITHLLDPCHVDLICGDSLWLILDVCYVVSKVLIFDSSDLNLIVFLMI